MREIKFRFACEDMSGDFFFHYFNLDEIYNSPMPLPLGHIGRIEKIKGRDQFTGLHDKNGKEIWEGDIIKFPDGDTPYEMRWCDIRYGGGWCPVNKKGIHVMLSLEIEVIGNVWENPELLESK